MPVRPYRPADLPRLTALHSRAERLPQLIAAGAQAWVIVAGEQLLGYATLVPVPGLPEIADLDCFITPAGRRQGLGSTLLQQLTKDVAGTGIRQLSHSVSSLASAAAHFLEAHHFYLEHEEWRLERPRLDQLSPFSLPAGCHFQTLAPAEAIRHFRDLYEQSFGDTPWYQPYTTAAEVASELDSARDLLFLFCEEEPVGFAWIRLGQGGIGEIEPFGIAPPFQGRGYGRLLLQAALHQLARQGVTRVHLGVWRRNRAALALYRSAGFEHTGTRYYLTRDLA